MIDYTLIAKAIKYYQSKGYKYVDLPWHTEDKYISITLPPECGPVKAVYPDKTYSLVGSAEQAFLAYKDKYRSPLYKKLMSVTPCFRDEKNITKYTVPYFLKLELMHILKPEQNSKECYYDMFFVANDFFRSLNIPTYNLNYPNNNSIDIMCSNLDGEIELGSYGYRQYFDFAWVYGTGLAEPRTSLCINSC